MYNKPPKYIYLQDKDMEGKPNYNYSPHDPITWCEDKINGNDSVYVHAPQLENKKAPLWAMKYRLDGCIDHLSIRRTKKQCIHDFEASFGQEVTPEYMSGWEAVKVMVVEL